MVPKNLTDERNTLGSILRRCFEALVETVYGRLGEQGFVDLRPAHGAVFRHVLPDGMRATELAARAGMTKQSMGYLVADLEARGYVEQGPDPTDGRAKVVRLTARGREAQAAAARISGEVEREWAARVGAAEWHFTRQTLGRLVEELDRK
ncbi:MAG: MarR family winged helix-turn-helix transcriptional regulator [Fimbriimonas sp.]